VKETYIIPQRFFENVEKYADKPALLSKIDGNYRPVLYRDLGNNVKSIGLVLDSWGIKHGDRVAIMSDNREEWVMADLANVSIGLVSVPIYPTLSPKQVFELLNHSNPRVLFIKKSKNTPQLVAGIGTFRIFIYSK